MLFAPSVTLPLMAVQDMPLGAQVMGQPHEDATVIACGAVGRRGRVLKNVPSHMPLPGHQA
jgi:Asp-tRNA(Asn)/Glu-tRNA(Gln) amidotransferase A subunit family amidase